MSSLGGGGRTLPVVSAPDSSALKALLTKSNMDSKALSSSTALQVRPGPNRHVAPNSG